MTSRVTFGLLLAAAGLVLTSGVSKAEEGSSTVTKRTVIHSSSNTKSDSAGSTSSSNSATTGNNTTSTETTVEQSGVMGFQKSNKFAPNYKKRLATYKDQIELGTKGGWLSADDADKFKKELARLTELESAVAAKNYVKPDIDDLDKQFTKFNMEFSNAGQKKSAPATTSTPPAAVPATAKPAEKPKTQATTRKAPAAAAKPAAKPASKPAAKK
jgi:hypothetical protein